MRKRPPQVTIGSLRDLGIMIYHLPQSMSAEGMLRHICHEVEREADGTARLLAVDGGIVIRSRISGDHVLDYPFTPAAYREVMRLITRDGDELFEDVFVD